MIFFSLADDQPVGLLQVQSAAPLLELQLAHPPPWQAVQARLKLRRRSRAWDTSRCRGLQASGRERSRAASDRVHLVDPRLDPRFRPAPIPKNAVPCPPASPTRPAPAIRCHREQGPIVTWEGIIGRGEKAEIPPAALAGEGELPGHG